MLLFGKLVDETQMGNPRDHAVRDIASKFSIFLPLRAIYFRSYRYETPCTFILELVHTYMRLQGQAAIRKRCLCNIDDDPDQLFLFSSFEKKIKKGLSLPCVACSTSWPLSPRRSAAPPCRRRHHRHRRHRRHRRRRRLRRHR